MISLSMGRLARGQIRFNRVPEPTLWATVVAERLGYLPETVLSQTFLMNERSSGSRISLFRQGIELLRRTQFACQYQLALPDHVH